MGKITKIKGPLILATGIKNPRIHDLVSIGDKMLLGEIIGIESNKIRVQAYEPTENLNPGNKIFSLQKPLCAQLGPGLIGNVFDGLQRPLKELEREYGYFIKRGVTISKLDEKKKWDFEPTVKEDMEVFENQTIGYVNERRIKHRILVPPNISGTISNIDSGKKTIREPIAWIGKKEIFMSHEWPVRKGREVKNLLPNQPLITGQRFVDCFFPLAKGGTSVIPGPFGSGKTVFQQCLTKFSNADVKIFLGCGERGNEMADLLSILPTIKDEKGVNVLDKSVFFINTSNMSLMARESGIYMASAVGEYFRQMGYDVLLMADSTSRWAEALRDLSGIIGELPAEEGFPAYLPSRINKFYERAGRIEKGSLTIIGSISPPGGDFSEPVTQYSLVSISCAWFLNSELAFKRFFPAIDWTASYSNYFPILKEWWKSVDPNWSEIVNKALYILQREKELEELVKAVGFAALSVKEKIILNTARIIREGFLSQNAFHPNDQYSPPKKTARILSLIILYYEKCLEKVQTVPVDELIGKPIKEELIRLKEMSKSKFKEKTKELEKKIRML